MSSSGGSILVLIGILLLTPLGGVISSEDFRAACERIVTAWADQAIWELEAAGGNLEDKLKLQGLLFFLHIPRTGGRNYNQCFLKNLFLEEELCPRSYDKLRLDPRKPSCSLLSTHDDYSITHRLPKSTTSIVTNVRDPASRVLSAYEFSVEVAARFLRRSPTMQFKRTPPLRKTNLKSMSTLEIWPWKYLVPLLQRDLFRRRDLREAGELALPEQDPNVYDIPAYVMPLKEFVDHPAVHELVHNGATFQIAGITNNSYVKEAKRIRSCIAEYEDLGHHVLSVAKRRLDSMLCVGLTEKHKESAEIFAHLVGRQAAERKLSQEANKTNGAAPGSSNDEMEFLTRREGNDSYYEGFIDQMVHSYQKCSSTLRSTQVTRRITSLLPVAPVNFSKEARKTIPDEIMARIMKLNSMDYELYDHAKKLFQAERQLLSNLKGLEVVEVEVSTSDSPARQSPDVMIGLCTLISVSGLLAFVVSFNRRSDRSRSNIRVASAGKI